MSKHFVFVYGTLRRGGVRSLPNIFPGAKSVGRATVRGGLYDLGPYPGLLLDESSSSVIGEVYEVDDEILNKLDDMEASSYYRRKEVEVSLDNQRRVCWIYVPELEIYPQRTLITSGDWIEYAKTKKRMP